MKLFIIGLGRHGKDTLSELLNKHYELSFCSSSFFLAEKVIMPAMPGYMSVKECYEDRVNHRETWFKLINQYNTPDLSKLSKSIFARYDIYCGIRNIEELKASRHMSDLVIWVDAEKRLGITEDPSSISVTKEDADIIITNNGTAKEFEEKVLRIFSKLL